MTNLMEAAPWQLFEDLGHEITDLITLGERRINHGRYNDNKLVEQQALGRDCYFHPAVVPQHLSELPNISDKDIRHSKAVWVDLDPDSTVTDYANFTKRVLAVIDDVQITPKYVLCTGRGVQVYHVFKTKISTESCEKLNKLFAEYYSYVMPPDCKVDSAVTNISRLMRFPNTVNTRTGVKGHLFKYEVDYLTMGAGLQFIRDMQYLVKDLAPTKPARRRTVGKESEKVKSLVNACLAPELFVPGNDTYNDALRVVSGMQFCEVEEDFISDWISSADREGKFPDRAEWYDGVTLGTLKFLALKYSPKAYAEWQQQNPTEITDAGPKRYSALVETARDFYTLTGVEIPDYLKLKPKNEEYDIEKYMHYHWDSAYIMDTVDDLTLAISDANKYWTITSNMAKLKNYLAALVYDSFKLAREELNDINILHNGALTDYIEIYDNLVQYHCSNMHIIQVVGLLLSRMKARPEEFKTAYHSDFNMSLLTHPVIKMPNGTLDLLTLEILSTEEVKDRLMLSTVPSCSVEYDPEYLVNLPTENRYYDFYDDRLLSRIAYFMISIDKTIDVVMNPTTNSGKTALYTLLSKIHSVHLYPNASDVINTRRRVKSYSQLEEPLTRKRVAAIDEVQRVLKQPKRDKDGRILNPDNIPFLNDSQLASLTGAEFSIELKGENPITLPRIGTLVMVGARYPRIDFRTNSSGQGMNSRYTFVWTGKDRELQKDDFNELNSPENRKWISHYLIKSAHEQAVYKDKYGATALQYIHTTPYTVSSNYTVEFTDVEIDEKYAEHLEENKRCIVEFVEYSTRELVETEQWNTDYGDCEGINDQSGDMPGDADDLFS